MLAACAQPTAHEPQDACVRPRATHLDASRRSSSSATVGDSSHMYDGVSTTGGRLVLGRMEWVCHGGAHQAGTLLQQLHGEASSKQTPQRRRNVHQTGLVIRGPCGVARAGAVWTRHGGGVTQATAQHWGKRRTASRLRLRNALSLGSSGFHRAASLLRAFDARPSLPSL